MDFFNFKIETLRIHETDGDDIERNTYIGELLNVFDGAISWSVTMFDVKMQPRAMLSTRYNRYRQLRKPGPPLISKYITPCSSGHRRSAKDLYRLLATRVCMDLNSIRRTPGADPKIPFCRPFSPG